MSETLKCHFHQARNAISKCEDCGKILCIECKQIYTQTHHSGTGDNRRVFYTQHELCPPCLYDRKIKNLNPKQFLIPIMMGVLLICISLPLFIIMMMIALIPFNIIFVIIGIGLIVYGRKKRSSTPQKIDKLRAEKEDFYKLISSLEFEQISLNLGYKICPNCDSKEELNTQYCSECGIELISIH